MKLVLQRVSEAAVTVEGEEIGRIGKGYLLLLGIGEGDTKEMAGRLLAKVGKLRIFADENGKTNLDIEEVKGEVLIISQFTLYADCRKGNRPSFINAAGPALAEELYEYFVEAARFSGSFSKVAKGVFGAYMQVSLVNDGPFTLALEV
jgi:D-tyrosyl-tRNA(Tyr) deacylase